MRRLRDWWHSYADLRSLTRYRRARERFELMFAEDDRD